MAQAQVAGKLLGLHWTTVYRLRKRFLEDPVATAVLAKAPGPGVGSRRLDPEVEEVIRETLIRWLPRQRDLAHPQLDLTLQIRARCTRAGLTPPSPRLFVAGHCIWRRKRRHVWGRMPLAGNARGQRSLEAVDRGALEVRRPPPFVPPRAWAADRKEGIGH